MNARGGLREPPLTEVPQGWCPPIFSGSGGSRRLPRAFTKHPAGFFRVGEGGGPKISKARVLRNNRKGVLKGDLTTYYTNSRSLRNKINLLRGKTCVEEFDVMAITETWVDTANKNFLSEYEIDGYQGGGGLVDKEASVGSD